RGVRRDPGCRRCADPRQHDRVRQERPVLGRAAAQRRREHRDLAGLDAAHSHGCDRPGTGYAHRGGAPHVEARRDAAPRRSLRPHRLRGLQPLRLRSVQLHHRSLTDTRTWSSRGAAPIRSLSEERSDETKRIAKEYPMTEDIKKGLAGVVADVTAISKVNPETNSLLYRGYPVQELAATQSFEAVAYLLWHGELPTDEQLADFRAAERANRALP